MVLETAGTIHLLLESLTGGTSAASVKSADAVRCPEEQLHSDSARVAGSQRGVQGCLEVVSPDLGELQPEEEAEQASICSPAQLLEEVL